MNPEWPEQLTLRIVTSDLAGLSTNAHLFITVWDHDNMNPNDLIGVLVIPFRDIIASLAKGDPYDFAGECISDGVKQGYLSGKISLPIGSPPLVDSFLDSQEECISLTEWNNLNQPKKCACSCTVS